MHRGSFAVTAVAGLLSWAAVAEAQGTDATPPAGAAPTAPAKPQKAPPAAPPKAPEDRATAPAEAKPPAEGAAPGPSAPAESEAPATGAAPTAPAEPAPLPPEQPAPPASLGSMGLTPRTQEPAGVEAARPEHPAPGGPNEAVFAEDWWSHARPVFEIHGYFRTRAELFQNFSLGRRDGAVWPQPLDNFYTSPTAATGSAGPQLCTPAETGASSSRDNPATDGLRGCSNRTQAGANLRFRLDPELHISDNLRVISQIDILDNVVMGSTPSGFQFQPSASGGGYAVAPRGGYYPVGALDDTTVPPSSAVNSLSDSIRVKRVWAEYATPVGTLRFGRMPDHFGLGMVHNSGDGYDDDYQSTVDRLQFITAIKPLDLYIGGMWDFPNEGPTLSVPLQGAQPFDGAQLDDVNQWSLILMRKQSPELEKTSLAHGQVVLNGGAYVTLRKQLLANDQSGTTATSTAGANVPNATADQLRGGFSRRDATIWLPDFWLQLKYKKFRFEAEGAAVLGSEESDVTEPNAPTQQAFQQGGLTRKFRQYGIATELEQKLVEDRLRLRFNFGWASGDPNALNPGNNPNNLVPQPLQQEVNSDTISTFRFHPAYRVDLILFRNLLQRIQGAYYFKPSVEYDFMRKPSGQRLGGGASVVWSRASDFVQAPGHDSNLGIELDGRLYFQSKDGGLNDHPDKMGGFYAMLEYGVLFPLAGLDYMPNDPNKVDTSAAQILRLYLGVLF
jgi:uncharacterized protein (TIGR04551 family)